MAIELGTGYVSIVPSARGFQAALNREVGGDVDRFGTDAGNRSGSSFLGSFSRTVGGIGAVFAGLGIGRLISEAFSIAGDFQQTTIAFEGIIGNAKTAQQVLGELRDFAARTPFEFAGLAEASQQLLGVGFARTELLPVLGTIGDLTSALGVGQESINGVVRALGQMKGRGRVTAEELNQISQQVPGFSAIGAIAEHFGVSTAEAFDMVTAGAVPAEEGIAAILEGMRNFPGAAGAMERQSQTLNGVVSTFKDNLANIAIDFITPHLPAITRAITAFTPLLERIAGFVSDNLEPILAALGAVIAVVAGAFLASIGPVVLVAGAIAALVGGVVYAYQHFEGFRDIVDTVARFFVERVIPAIGQFVDWLRANLLPVVAEVASYIAEKFGEVVAWVEENWPAISEAIGHVMSVVQGIIETVTGAIKTIWETWGDEILTIIGTIWDHIKQVIETAINIVRGVIELVLAIINGDWGAAWDAIKGIVSTVWDLIKSTVETGINLVKTVISGVLDALKLIWSTAWGVMRGVVDGIWDGITGAFRGVINGVISILETGINIAIDLVNGAIGALDSALGPYINFGEIGHVHIGRIGGGGSGTGGGTVPIAGAFAKGGTFAGFGIVGEEGPELIYSPRTVGVIPNNMIGAAANGGTSNSEEVRLLREQNALLSAIASNTKDSGPSLRQLARSGAF